MTFVLLKQKRNSRKISCPGKESTQTHAIIIAHAVNSLSFYLRDSAVLQTALHLRYSRKRASPELHPFLVPTRTRAPESSTPSAGFRRSPKNFNCRYVIYFIKLACISRLVNHFFTFFSPRGYVKKKTPQAKARGVSCIWYQWYANPVGSPSAGEVMPKVVREQPPPPHRSHGPIPQRYRWWCLPRSHGPYSRQGRSPRSRHRP